MYKHFTHIHTQLQKHCKHVVLFYKFQINPYWAILFNAPFLLLDNTFTMHYAAHTTKILFVNKIIN